MKLKTLTLLLAGLLAGAGMAAAQADGDMRGMSRHDFVQVAENTVNGVVSVRSYATPQARQQYAANPLFEYFFGTPRCQPESSPREQQLGLGSGVIISPDGYIVTNNHVIEHAERLEVTLNDNRTYGATLVGTDPTTDVALLKIEADSLHAIPLGDSEALHVGEWVLAVGNPFGFTSTVTTGIVSAKARNISTTVGAPSAKGGIESFIQTDAALNSGNSGGALVNLDGELVGINTAIYSSTGTYAGCSFAIPVAIVSKVVDDLRNYGTVQRAFLGISFVELSPQLIADKKIDIDIPAGIYVASVQERSAAMEAGLEEGDVIKSISGRPTNNTAQMQGAIAHFSPGDTIAIDYWRSGKRQTAQAVLRNSRGTTATGVGKETTPMGAAFETLDAAQARTMGLRGGVVVSGVDKGGAFDAVGIKEGFVILSVNGQRVTEADDMMAIYRALEASGGVTDRALFITVFDPATSRKLYFAVPLE